METANAHPPVHSRQAPERTCIGCRRKGSQDELLRVSRSPGGRVRLWEKGSRGRSAYFCREPLCIDAGLGKGRLERALKVRVERADQEALRQELICKLR